MRPSWLFWALSAVLTLLPGALLAAEDLPPPRVVRPGEVPPRPAPSRPTPSARTVPAVPAAAPRTKLMGAITAAQQAELAFLEHLGWRVIAGPVGSGVTKVGGLPTQHLTIAAAQKHGLLQIRVAPDATADQLRQAGLTFGELGLGQASRLAYKHKVWRATYEATRKLAENTRRGNYTFPSILCFESPWFKMKPPQPEWQRGKWITTALARPSEALPAFYTRPGLVMECYTAQWVAMYCIQYELLGAQAIDQAYQPSELVLARPGQMRETPFGHYLPEQNSGRWRALVMGPDTVGKDPGVALAELGPVAWAGASGVTENVETELFTNDNLLFVNVTPRANKAFLKNGGLAYIQRQSEKIWKIHKHGRRGAYPGCSGLEAEQAIDKILQDPVFSETTVYIHPYGVKPLRWIMHHRIAETHRPIKVRIYRNGVADAFFRRYREHFLRYRARGR